ncbi:MAG: hypothetical protein GY788_01085 [bacterium]|nr:hypothetical protein [bacterium]
MLFLFMFASVLAMATGNKAYQVIENNIVFITIMMLVVTPGLVASTIIVNQPWVIAEDRGDVWGAVALVVSAFVFWFMIYRLLTEEWCMDAAPLVTVAAALIASGMMLLTIAYLWIGVGSQIIEVDGSNTTAMDEWPAMVWTGRFVYPIVAVCLIWQTWRHPRKVAASVPAAMESLSPMHVAILLTLPYTIHLKRNETASQVRPSMVSWYLDHIEVIGSGPGEHRTPSSDDLQELLGMGLVKLHRGSKVFLESPHFTLTNRGRAVVLELGSEGHRIDGERTAHNPWLSYTPPA